MRHFQECRVTLGRLISARHLLPEVFYPRHHCVGFLFFVQQYRLLLPTPTPCIYDYIYVYVRFPWFPFTCEISQEKRPWVARFRWQADGKLPRLPRPLAWLKTIQVGAEYVENAKKSHGVGIQLMMMRLVISDHDMILSRSYPG